MRSGFATREIRPRTRPGTVSATAGFTSDPVAAAIFAGPGVVEGAEA
jgi:hypothetical protein